MGRRYVRVTRTYWEPRSDTNGGLWLLLLGALVLGAAAMGGAGHVSSLPAVGAVGVLPPAVSPRVFPRPATPLIGPSSVPVKASPPMIPPPPVPQAVRCVRERGPGWCWGRFEVDRGYVPNPFARRCIRHPSETAGWCWNVYRTDL